ncbi:MAG TPA: DUF4034 domain-containing protein [Candidatus Binataceae bacterium]|nr:DUF4034 domain-containing protein [Candidatus Binataceae bacterium]
MTSLGKFGQELTIAIAIVSGLINVAAAADATTHPDFLAELSQRKFTELEAQIDSYQKEFEKSVTAEEKVGDAFDTFSNADPTVGDLLAEWVKASPNSYISHTADAEYLCSAGWNARGGGYATEVAADSFKRMGELLSQADQEARQALKLNPKVIAAYNILIVDGKSQCDYSTMISQLDAALAQCPACYGPRYNFIQALVPQWCGRREEMAQFVTADVMAQFAAAAQKFAAQNPQLKPDEAMAKFLQEKMKSAGQTSQLTPEEAMAKFAEEAQKTAGQSPLAKRLNEITGGKQSYEAMAKVAEDAQKYVGQNPRLKYLKGIADEDQASEALYQQKYDAAVKFYTQAIEKAGDSWSYYQKRAEAYYALRQFDNALSDLNHAHALLPESPRTIKYRAYVLASMEGGEGPQAAYEQAIKAYDAAIARGENLWPNYEDRAEMYELLQQYEKALADLNRADALSPGNSVVIWHRASVLADMGRSDDALAEIARYRKLFPQDSSIDQLEKSVQYSKQVQHGEVPAWQPGQHQAE